MGIKWLARDHHDDAAEDDRIEVDHGDAIDDDYDLNVNAWIQIRERWEHSCIKQQLPYLNLWSS